MNLAFLNDRTPLEAALYYAKELKLQVFPLHNVVKSDNGHYRCSCGKSHEGDKNLGKHPRTPHGFLDATTQEAQILDWWKKNPFANIGIRTGGNLLVLDFDAATGGLASLSEVTSIDEGLKSTPVVQTGGGGLHLYALIPSVSGRIDCRSGVWPGVDIRAEGGYVVAPPSIHWSGHHYLWINEDKELQEVSTDLLEKIRLLRGQDTIQFIATSEKRIPQGQRNSTLFRLAASRRSNRWPYEDTLEFLRRTNHDRCDPLLDEDEIQAICDSAYKLPEKFEKTDVGNSYAFVSYFGSDLRYAKERVWLEFQDGVWQMISDARINHFAVETTNLIREYAVQTNDEPLIKHAYGSRSNHRLKNMIEQARTPLQVSLADFDRNPWELPCDNGIFDLKEGSFRTSRRSDLVLKRIPVAYNPTAPSPKVWLQCIEDWMQGDREKIAYLHRMIGYWLTGSVEEDAFFVFHGSGANGKTTFLTTVQQLMGHFAITLPSEYFMPNSRISKEQYSARLHGARLAISSETSEHARLDSSLIKTLTGRDEITAKVVFREPYAFFPTHKVVISTNHRPRITDDSEGMWRRVHLVAWGATFGVEKRDKTLQWKLQSELEGILRYEIENGCNEWKRSNLGIPLAVARATEEYRHDMDIIGDFLAECFVFEEGSSVRSSAMFPIYVGWATENRVFPKIGKQELLAKLRLRSEIKTGETHGNDTFRGIHEKPRRLITTGA